ncbi:unnamed protein product [Adineta ricciae]|uniref:G-protein coupled receptors family 1 profile domain-containing protein n=1 Tax=Adineta ricciae TaxID=249248 RepID=A0A816DPH3_ADIRI|nr:unnamed protein product [Adineta ricciae]CAF1639224.1 unnamed protein product [Adineta ricciae]
MLILLTLLGIIFSATVILTIVLHWRAHCRSVVNLLICNSCLTLLFLGLTVIFQVSHMNKYEENTIFCRFRAALYLSACMCASLSYLIQAISRYFITILYKYRFLATFRTNIILILLIWVYSFILPALVFISPSAYQHESESRMCVLTTKLFYTSFLVVTLVFIVPISIIITLYFVILRQSTGQSRTYFSQLATPRMKRTLKVFRNVMISVIVLAIGGTPYVFCVIMNTFIEIPWQLYSTAFLFISLSATLNSLALFFINRQIRLLVYKNLHFQQTEYEDTTTDDDQAMPQTIRMPPTII